MRCARCKKMRKACRQNCEYAKLFPAEKSQEFANIHSVFRAAHFRKMLHPLKDERGDAFKSMAYEAKIRVNDPIHGCYGKIRALEQEVKKLKRQLADREEAAQSVKEEAA